VAETPYRITIDCNQNPLTEVYEWLQHVTRNGETGTTATDGIEGEQYVGPTVYLAYSGTVTGTVSEGSDVTQATSGATGIVVSHDTINKVLLLRDTRGTFNTANAKDLAHALIAEIDHPISTHDTICNKCCT
jgi:hypothetical protein